MKVAFLATPPFAVPTLNVLVKAGHDVAVFTAPPRKRGRGHKVQPSPVAVAAENLGLPIETPETHHEVDLSAFDVGVVVAYGMILPERILYAPKHGCINGHASLLPRWRGAAPIERAIEAGDQKTGVCIMDMVRELDAGDVILKQEVPIHKTDNAENLYERLSQLTAKLIIDVLNTPTPWQRTPQDKEGITYAHKITPETRKINWHQTGDAILNHIRGFYPHAWMEIHGQRVKVLTAEEGKPYDGKPGDVVENATLCKDSSIKPRIIRPAGKPEMMFSDFIRKFPMET